MHPWLAASIVLGVLASWTAGARLDFRDLSKPSIQPRPVAFSIWIVIFPLLLATASSAGSAVFPPRAVVALVGSLVLATAWAVAIDLRWTSLAAATLLLAASAAWLSSAWCAFDPTARSWLVRAALGLYAGWLSVAALLALSIADARWDSPVALVFAACAVSVASTALRQPFACAAVAWAVLLEREPTIARIALLPCAVGAVFASM